MNKFKRQKPRFGFQFKYSQYSSCKK